MNMLRRTTVSLLALLLSPIRGRAQAASKSTAEVGKQLREMFLSTTAGQAGLSATPEFPHVFGAALDWPIGEHIATVVALADGTASLYTTSTFGIIGGSGHSSVRRAAQRFVATAEKHLAESVRTLSHPYPVPNKVRFYLLAYDGTRTIEADLEPTYSGAGKYSPLFGAGQDVVTELRQITERQ
jgi:hypothetical protein